MNEHAQPIQATPSRTGRFKKSRAYRWAGIVAALAVVLAIGATYYYTQGRNASAVAAPAPASVMVSAPLERDIERRLGFLGQFSAVNRVELRAQVGGVLTHIHFKDGDTVHKGDLLFEIDPEPYEIKLKEATALLVSAKARLALATRELSRARELQRSEAGSVQNVDQKTAEYHAAQADVDHADAQVLDARFDLDHSKIAAPFSGRMGAHLVSAGNLISGSRAGSNPTTLLATIVSLDPIYVDFDMSENDYATFQQARQGQTGALSNQVMLSPTGDNQYSRLATLDFLDNVLDRSSGTLHARATVPNGDLALTPGGFARIRLAVSKPRPTLLVPDAAVLADQTDRIVYVVGEGGVVATRKVEVGDLRGGLREIRAGLSATDKVIIGGIPSVRPGAKVTVQEGTIQYSAEAERIAAGDVKS